MYNAMADCPQRITRKPAQPDVQGTGRGGQIWDSLHIGSLVDQRRARSICGAKARMDANAVDLTLYLPFKSRRANSEDLKLQARRTGI